MFFRRCCFFFFFNDTATTEIYTLSLHDALPISALAGTCSGTVSQATRSTGRPSRAPIMSHSQTRSEEHTSELQSRGHLVCRLLLEKKKKNQCRPSYEKKKKKTKYN